MLFLIADDHVDIANDILKAYLNDFLINYLKRFSSASKIDFIIDQAIKSFLLLNCLLRILINSLKKARPIEAGTG